jgi:predicted nucleic acid-binding protein
MIVFVDTSAFYAGLDRDDINHSRAKNAWTDLLAGETRLLTSNYVLLETSALVQKRLGPVALRLFYRDVAPLLAAILFT